VVSPNERENTGLFEHRHFDTGKAIEPAHAVERFDDMAERFGLCAKDVLRAADGLGGLVDGGAHGQRA